MNHIATELLEKINAANINMFSVLTQQIEARDSNPWMGNLAWRSDLISNRILGLKGGSIVSGYAEIMMAL